MLSFFSPKENNISEGFVTELIFFKMVKALIKLNVGFREHKLC